MDHQGLKAFVSVAKHSSFSDAADQLYLTQSAVSKRIASLELQLGKKLFDRLGRTIALTEAGIALLPRAKQILRQFDQASQALDDLSGHTRGTLRLAISHHLGLHRLPIKLQQFTRTYPEVRLDIQFMDSEKAYENVLSGDAEVGVITLALESHSNVISQRIWQDPMMFVCATNHALGRLTTPTLEDLAKYPVILPGLNTVTGRIIQELFSSRGITLTRPLLTNYLETIATLVEIGLGWSVLPTTLIKDTKTLRVQEPSLFRELGYIHHRQRSLSNAALAFIGVLEDVAPDKSSRFL